MKLIINADDFGLSESINDGIIQGIKNGWMTSTTLMVNMLYAKDAIEKAMKHHISCIGLHINLTKGKSITEARNLVDENGNFLSHKQQLKNQKITYQETYDEIMAQIEKVKEYSGGKLKIDHLDTHHFLTSHHTIKQAIEDIAKTLNLPVRNENQMKAKCPDILYMDFTIENVNLEALRKLANLYQNKSVTVELVTHPGFIDEYTKTITGYLNRKQELDVLMQAKKLELFKDVEMINYAEI